MTAQQPTVLSVEGLSEAEFAAFGTAILEPAVEPTSHGDGFQCWFGVGTLRGHDFRLGQVVAEKPAHGITKMERHDHAEFLLPVTGPLVQVVAPAGDFSNADECPAGAAARAFLIEPGESVVIEAGTWHAAAVPVEATTLYYFAAVPDVPGTPGGLWMPFDRQQCFELNFD